MAISGMAVRNEFKEYGNGLKDYTDAQMDQVMEAADRLSYAAGRGEVESVADEFDAEVLSLCKLQSEAEACISAIRKARSYFRASVQSAVSKSGFLLTAERTATFCCCLERLLISRAFFSNIISM
jgi:hypothetical protein